MFAIKRNNVLMSSLSLSLSLNWQRVTTRLFFHSGNRSAHRQVTLDPARVRMACWWGGVVGMVESSASGHDDGRH